MTKRTKKLIYFAIFVLIIVSGLVYRNRTQEKGSSYVLAKVTKGKIVQTVRANGSVESAQEIELNFKTTGQIAKIYVDVGSKVKTGQLLVSLEAGALQSKVADAQANLAEAKTDLEKVLAGAPAEDIKVSEETLAQKEQVYKSKQNDLENIKKKRDTELNNLKDETKTTLNNEIVVAEGAIQEIDNTLADPDAENTLSILDSGALLKAKDSLSSAEKSVTDSKSLIDNITSNSSDREIQDTLDNLKETLNEVMEALSDTSDVLKATIISNKLTESELDTLKSNIKSEQVKINTSRTNVQTAKSNWTDKIAYYIDQVKKYEDEVEETQKDLNVAKAQLEFKKAPPRSFEIETAKAKVEQAEASLNLALVNLQDTIIKAPVAGTITKKNNEKGEQSSITTPVLKMIAETNLEIEAEIPESDIAKVKIGQEVDITLDAFGDEKHFAGKVTFIDPAATIIQDVVYYEIKVSFAKKEIEVKPGMTANLTIETAKKDNVLFVPKRAIKEKNDKKYVEVLVDGMPQEREVALGLRGDEGIEIVSGVSEEEEVVTYTKSR